MFQKFRLLLLVSPLLLASCVSLPFGNFGNSAAATAAIPNDPTNGTSSAFKNPFPEGTYDHFKAEPSYKTTYNIYRDHSLLSSMSPETASLSINIATQRAQLMHNGQIAMDYPVATGKSSHPTPTGEYQILEKIKDKRSNTYGKILDANGNVVNSSADARKDEIPAGGKFLGAKMPYWMRFTWTGIGHHVGNVPRHPASHGCIRGRSATMPEIYSKVKVGTPVSIVDY